MTNLRNEHVNASMLAIPSKISKNCFYVLYVCCYKVPIIIYVSRLIQPCCSPNQFVLYLVEYNILRSP